MSQKKVDAYKQQKANRKEIIKKEKRMLLIEKAIGLAVCAVAVIWVGYSVYDKITDTSGVEVVKQDTVIDTSALDDYTASLTADDTSVEDGTEAEEIEEADAEDTQADADEDAESEDTEDDAE